MLIRDPKPLPVVPKQVAGPTGRLLLRPRCLVCRHLRKREIDLALLAGESTRRIAERYGASHAGLSRHQRVCLPRNLFEARQANTFSDADFLLSKVIELQHRAEL